MEEVREAVERRSKAARGRDEEEEEEGGRHDTARDRRAEGGKQ